MRSALGCLILLVLIVIGALTARDYVRKHPQEVPWTELSLNDPIGEFTGRKLAALGDDPAQCRALLREVGSSNVPVPPRNYTADCGYEDGIRLIPPNTDAMRYAPPQLVTSCPVAAALFLLEHRIIQPAALRHFGSRVIAIDHAGSYSCRRLYARSEGSFSEHATADAFDIVGFRLANGQGVSVLRDWSGEPRKAAFLREVRDGACDLFSTVLSPDYNAAHADHLHLDQAERGSMGWRLCR